MDMAAAFLFAYIFTSKSEYVSQGEKEIYTHTLVHAYSSQAGLATWTGTDAQTRYTPVYHYHDLCNTYRHLILLCSWYGLLFTRKSTSQPTL